jgi:hypothetical protein
MTTVFLVIAALGLAGAGFFLVISFSLLRVVGSQRRKIRQEAKERHQVVEAIKEATRIASAYDATIAIRKFIEAEQAKLPQFFVETGDPDEPYAPYDLNIARMWMKPIRILLETEFTYGAEAEDQTDTSKEKKEEDQPSDSEE